MAENPSNTNPASSPHPADLAALARELFEMVEEYKLTAREAADIFDKSWSALTVSDLVAAKIDRARRLAKAEGR